MRVGATGMTNQPPSSHAGVYLDHAAAAPPLPEVVADHAALCEEYFHNPHAAASPGSEACRRRILLAERELLALLDIPPESADVVWTSGGTEALNLAVLGSFQAVGAGTCLVETTAHHALLEPCRQAAAHGMTCRELPVDSAGAIQNPEMCTDASIVALCHVNNETGALQDVQAIQQHVRRDCPRARLIVDAMQSFTKHRVPWNEAGIDLLAAGGRKIGGPAAVGVLVVRKGTVLTPLMFGGSQQKGLRPGTLDTVGILEFVRAASIQHERLQTEPWRVRQLNRRVREALGRFTAHPVRILSPEEASPFILAVAFPGKQGAVLARLLAERGVVVGTGSACSAESEDVGHVLKAMGVSDEAARGTLRLSFSWSSDESDADRFINELKIVLEMY